MGRAEADRVEARVAEGIWAEDITKLYEKFRTHASVVRELAVKGYSRSDIASFVGKREEQVREILVKEAATR